MQIQHLQIFVKTWKFLKTSKTTAQHMMIDSTLYKTTFTNKYCKNKNTSNFKVTFFWQTIAASNTLYCSHLYCKTLTLFSKKYFDKLTEAHRGSQILSPHTNTKSQLSFSTSPQGQFTRNHSWTINLTVWKNQDYKKTFHISIQRI